MWASTLRWPAIGRPDPHAPRDAVSRPWQRVDCRWGGSLGLGIGAWPGRARWPASLWTILATATAPLRCLVPACMPVPATSGGGTPLLDPSLTLGRWRREPLAPVTCPGSLLPLLAWPSWGHCAGLLLLLGARALRPCRMAVVAGGPADSLFGGCCSSCRCCPGCCRAERWLPAGGWWHGPHRWRCTVSLLGPTGLLLVHQMGGSSAVWPPPTRRLRRPDQPSAPIGPSAAQRRQVGTSASASPLRLVALLIQWRATSDACWRANKAPWCWPPAKGPSAPAAFGSAVGEPRPGAHAVEQPTATPTVLTVGSHPHGCWLPDRQSFVAWQTRSWVSEAGPGSDRADG